MGAQQGTPLPCASGPPPLQDRLHLSTNVTQGAPQVSGALLPPWGWGGVLHLLSEEEKTGGVSEEGFPIPRPTPPHRGESLHVPRPQLLLHHEEREEGRDIFPFHHWRICRMAHPSGL